MFLSALSLNAQPKPKRDKSKDIVVHVKQRPLRKESVKQTPPSRVNKPRKKESFKSRRQSAIKRPLTRHKRRRNSIKKTIFLTVDYSDSPIKYISSEGGRIELSINTNSSEWDYRNVGSWYYVTGNWINNTISINVEKNTSSEERKDWFEVYCGGKSVRVTIIQNGCPVKASCVINNVSLTHNTYYNSNNLKKL